MKFEDLKLPSGARMKLTVSVPGAKAGDRLVTIQAQFVGVHAQRAIIAALPGAAIGSLGAGSKVGVSMVSPTDVVTFTAAIEAVTAAPFPHIFLTYPDSLSVRTVRAAARVNVGVSALVTNLSAEDAMEMFQAQIVDMSTSGLKLVTREVIGGIDDELAVQVQLSVDNIGRDIMLNGTIRSHSESADSGDQPMQTYGVEFAHMGDDKRVWLYAFVFCMIQRRGPQM